MRKVISFSNKAIAASCCVLAGMSYGCKQNEAQPNIILIYMDDMGYGDLSVTGAKLYETPNIDRLASQGVIFTSYYAPQAVSSASRAGVLTGCYPNRVGITGALFPASTIGLNSEETTISEVLKSVKYSTFAIGKWHVGNIQQYGPLLNGFDEFFGLPYSNDMWPVNYDGTPKTGAMNHPTLCLYEGNSVVDSITTFGDQDQLTTRYTERAVKIINEHKNEPFFIYLAHSMPHVPLGVSDKFKGKSGQGMYGDVMMEIDWSVGEIMKALENNGIEDNTLIVFTSDNGPWLNFGNHAGSSGGLREGKSTTWEGGQKVPCIMRWPNMIPAGFVCNELASSIDLLPTFAEISGAELPKNKIDGVSILTLMQRKEGAQPRKEFYYYFQKNSLEAVQSGQFKLVFPHSYNSYTVQPGSDRFPGRTIRITVDSLELYDLRRDPGERYNVINMYPDIVEKLQVIASKARADLGDDLVGQEGTGRRQPGGDISSSIGLPQATPLPR